MPPQHSTSRPWRAAPRNQGSSNAAGGGEGCAAAKGQRCAMTAAADATRAARRATPAVIESSEAPSPRWRGGNRAGEALSLKSNTRSNWLAHTAQSRSMDLLL